METYTMSRKRLSVWVGSLVLAGVMGIIVVRVALGSQAGQITSTPLAQINQPFREASGGIDSPAVSFIDSPSAMCSRPVAGTGTCYIGWNYLYVTAASGSYIISMTVSIDNQLRAYHSGFFQSSMYIPGDMTLPGYKVTCGIPGSGGKIGWGKSYAYTIRARDTNGLSAANYGAVTCPADVVRIYLPLLAKN
jgi:hypothetical protein